MFDIRNAQRSFNNSWLLRELSDIPSGVVLDIAITTPLQGVVHVAKMTESDGYLSLSLKQGDVEIAYVRTSVVGDPVRMKSGLPGVCAVIVLGFIPTGMAFTNPRNADQPLCVISPELVTYFNYNYLATGETPSQNPPGGGGGEEPPGGDGGGGGDEPPGGGSGDQPPGGGDVGGGGDGGGSSGGDGAFSPTLDIVNDYTTTTHILTGPVDIILDPGLYELPDSTDLIIDIDPITLGWTVVDTPGISPLTSINGISYPTNIDKPTINIKITPLIGGTINVLPGDYVITLEAPELQTCSAEDPIDKYIHPDTHSDKCVLDKCYNDNKVRDTLAVLGSRVFGFNGNLKVTEIDEQYD